MSSLTRSEAIERARLIAVDSYAISLDLRDDAFTSRTVVEFRGLAPGASTFAEVKGAPAVHAKLNGAEVPVVDGRVVLDGLAAQNRLEAEFTAAYAPSGEGILRFVDPEDGATYLYGQAPLDDAQRMFVCFDQPDLKAPMTLTITAPPQWTVRGNAPLAASAPGRWEFAETPPLSTYLFSFVAGPWHLLEREHDGIPLALLCRRSLAPALDADAEELFGATAAAFDRYHALFGVRYPFAKYDQAFVPEFSGGAVENPALVNYREEFLFRAGATDSDRHRRAVVMAHEMAHMWFGNLVTLRWWDDVWLNESFAELMGWRVAAETGRHPTALADFAIWRERWGYLADERPSTHPVAPEGVANTAVAFQNFDGISYAKGAAALRQLAVHLGDDVFLAGLRRYFERYRFANASLADFLAVIGGAAGQDLTGWAELWLRSTGANTLRAVASRGAAGLLVEQTGRPLRPHALTVAAFASDGSVQRTAFVLEGSSTAVPGVAAAPAGTVVLLNAEDETYAKIRFDPFSRAALPAVLPDLDDPVARAVIWTAVIDAVRDGELAPSEFQALLVAALPGERQEGVFDEVMAFARDSLARRGLIPYEVLADVCVSALSAAAPGTPRRLATERVLSTVAGAPRLRAWLDGGGVDDADLRWALLLRLSALGAATPDELAAEEARDPSAKGAERAVACRAASPDPQAKAAAWHALVHDPNPRVAVTNAEAFWQPGQGALTDAYAERYFEDLPAMLSGRYLLAALKVAKLAFPLLSPRALAPAEAMLARTDLDPLVRREIADGADELRRWA
ncbi:aminopeptidase N [Dactylosporangium sp. CS-033363]|uniref:aminopeptidase N n=1 Tax=Dactylosporangium sp. CS-033363 TaxID=3239935 RepID=UPI003D94930E